MITSITPLRVSLFGGGTDFPEYFKKKNCIIIGGTIDKYIYISLNNYYSNLFDHKIKLFYNMLEFVNSINSIKHPVVKKVFTKEKLFKNLEMHIAADLPSSSGLGSSSAFAVGLVNVVDFYKDKKKISKLLLAKKVIKFEREELNEYVGFQDQIFSSMGGFAQIEIDKRCNIKYKKYKNKKFIKKIEKNLFLVFSGIKRSASKIEKKKIKKIEYNIKLLNEINSIALDSHRKILKAKSPDFIGENLHKTWNIKKKLDKNVSNSKIDKIYDKAIKYGAIGGKLLGAGSGGFLLFYVPQKQHKLFLSKFRNAFVKFKFSEKGSKVIKY
jgi:D-glycero-alpha-D-manno-heptose-7-phosphate kinase